MVPDKVCPEFIPRFRIQDQILNGRLFIPGIGKCVQNGMELSDGVFRQVGSPLIRYFVDIMVVFFDQERVDDDTVRVAVIQRVHQRPVSDRQDTAVPGHVIGGDPVILVQLRRVDPVHNMRAPQKEHVRLICGIKERPVLDPAFLAFHEPCRGKKRSKDQHEQYYRAGYNFQIGTTASVVRHNSNKTLKSARK